MKKLLLLVVLMGLVTGVNAQTIAAERDIFTEQALYSISSLKGGSEKAFFKPSLYLGTMVAEDAGLNLFQYVQQPLDYISIASISYDSVRREAGAKIEGIGGVELILEITGSDAAQLGEVDNDYVIIEKINS